ncbi:LemA family protein [Sphingosinicella ginsenosidimutans]
MLTSFLLALPREGFTMRRGLYAVLAALVVTLSACGINSIPTAEENAKAKWAEVQNQYQRRADLVPNLVATVRAAATQERTVLREVTEARASASRITVTPDQLTDPAAMQRYAAAQTQLTLTLQRLQEAYPELHTNENFLTLQSQLEGTENRIAVARRDYNAAVQAYNTEIRTFPAVIGAKVIYGSQPMQPYQADEAAQRAPSVADAFGNNQ